MNPITMNPSVASPQPVAASADVPVSDQGSLRAALGLLIIGVLLCGLAYPLAGVGLGQALFAAQANGSVIERNERVIGSALVGQPFVSERFFQSRPSAVDYDPMAAGGSNMARTNPALRAQIDALRQTLSTRYGVDPAAIPSDLLTASGAGIDPDISPLAAEIQIDSVARARGMSRAALAQLVQQHTQAKQFGLLGQPRVNVLALNLALEALPAQPQAGQ